MLPCVPLTPAETMLVRKYRSKARQSNAGYADVSCKAILGRAADALRIGERLDRRNRSREDGIRNANIMRPRRSAPAELFIAVLVMLHTFAGARTTHAQGKGQTPAGPTS